MQEFQIFLLICPMPVVLFLPGNVALDVFAVRRTDAECAIALLPCKGTVAGLVMNPFRGNHLNVANHIGEPDGGGKAEKEVDMVGDAADSFGNATGITRHATEVCVESLTPFRSDAEFAVFRRKNDVEME